MIQGVCYKCKTNTNIYKQQRLCRLCWGSYMRVWRKKNPEKVNKANRDTQRKYNSKIRLEVLNAYGNKCACCGETQQEFLELDHINGDGSKERRSLKSKSGVATWRYIKKLGFPKDRYQLLCCNCNNSLGRYGYCPHNPSIIRRINTRTYDVYPTLS